MFGNKKKDEQKPTVDNNYLNWDKDLGFLILQINRQIGYAEAYEIPSIISVMKDNKAEFIKDADIEDLHRRITDEIFTDLNDNYIQYLCTKYFKDDRALVKFIDETVYTSLIDSCIKANSEKIQRQSNNKLAETIENINKSINKNS